MSEKPNRPESPAAAGLVFCIMNKGITPAIRRREAVLAAFVAAVLIGGCSGMRPPVSSSAIAMPEMVPHADWEVHPALGYDADAMRRNLPVGDSLHFRGMALTAARTLPAATDEARDSVHVELSADGSTSTVALAEGSARIWNAYRIAVVAIHLGEDELGRGLTEFEVALASTVPESIRYSGDAGGPAQRLRVRHSPTHVTLHHSGSAEPLAPEDDVVQKLRDLQTWGESDRGWWDVPYHFLIGLDGTIYEGRSFEYMGETNTTYNPWGHLLISVLGNYSLQEPTADQLKSIEDLMAWSAAEFGIPLDRIQGHSDLAPTECPGDNLRTYLEDGTFRRAVRSRLDSRQD